MLCFLAFFVAAAVGQQPGSEWQPLFNGKELGSWKESLFPRRGTVTVENQAIVLGAGAPMTGITWAGEFPKSNYEIRWEAARLKGGDFFSSLTFPVSNSFATWVTGGWGGDIVGISSIDGWDASDNETRTYFNFENDHWYSFRIRVTDDRISAWIDEKPIVNVVITGRAIGLRQGDIKLSTPLGIASYNTKGAVRKLEYRSIKPQLLFVAMDGVRGECGIADGDVFGTLFERSRVAHPFALVRHHRLTGMDIERAAFKFNPYHSGQHVGDLIELRLLARLHPSLGTSHMGDTHVGSICIYAANHLVDDFRLGTGGLDSG